MTDHDTKQDHPGPEWVEIDGKFYCPGLGMEMSITIGDARPLAATRCRAISAAALEWERMKQYPLLNVLEQIRDQLMNLEMSARNNRQ